MEELFFSINQLSSSPESDNRNCQFSKNARKSNINGRRHPKTKLYTNNTTASKNYNSEQYSDGVSSSNSSTKKSSNIRLARLCEPEKQKHHLQKSPIHNRRKRNTDSFSQLLKQQSGGAIAKNADLFAGTKSSPDPSTLPMPPKHWYSASNSNASSTSSDEQRSLCETTNIYTNNTNKTPVTTPKRTIRKENLIRSTKPKEQQQFAPTVQNLFAAFTTSPRRQVLSTA